MINLVRSWSRWLTIAAAGVIGLMGVVVTGSVLARYVFGAPFAFTEEEAIGLLFCVSAFLPVAATILDDTVIKVGPADSPSVWPRLTMLRRLGRDAATVAFLGILAWLLFGYALQSEQFGARLPASGLLVHPWAFGVALVTTITVVFILTTSASRMRSGTSNDSDKERNL